MARGFNFGEFYEAGEAFSPGALRLEVALSEDVDPVALTRGEWVPDALCSADATKANGASTCSAQLTPHYKSLRTRWSTLSRSRGSAAGVRIRLRSHARTREIEGYQGLSALGRCGPVHHDAALLQPMAPGGEPVEGWRGLLFDPETWDGSDIFSPEGTAHLIVSQSVKHALEEAQASNWLLVALPAWEMVSAD
jgi:hypothetical protein